MTGNRDPAERTTGGGPGSRRLGYVLKRFPRISETFVAAEIIELERQGEDVTIFAISRPDEPFTHGFLNELRAPVIYLPHRPARQPARVARAIGYALRTNARGWARAAAVSVWPPRWAGVRHLLQATVLQQELARAGITHAHAHFATAAARLANLAWRMGGPTYSVTAHAKDVWHRDVRPDHLRDKLASATFVATVSEANRVHLDSLLGFEGPRVRVVPNSVDVDRFVAAPARERHRVVTVARLVEKKGVGDLVEACSVLRNRAGPAIRLEVVGDGPLRPELEAASASAGLDVTFTGAIPHDEVLARVAGAAAFCLPCVVAGTGDRDGLPTAVLEAMALGVPVVTTGVNGLADAVVDGDSGLIVPERDPVALADALARLLGDAALADRLAANARRRIEERFALQQSVALLRSLFPSTTGEAPPGEPIPAPLAVSGPGGQRERATV